MAKIKKLIEDNVIHYPATITDAVKNPNNGKTVTEELTELGSKGIASIKLLGTDFTGVESLLLNALRKITITGYDKELEMTLVVNNGVISTLNFVNSDDNLFIIMGKNVVDNGNGALYSEYSGSFNSSIIHVVAEIDITGLENFSYSYDSVNAPNIKFVSTVDQEMDLRSETEIRDVIVQKSIVSITPNKGGSKLLNSMTMYYKFFLGEPVIVGSIVLDVKDVPSTSNNWVQVAIYPKDNGTGSVRYSCMSEKVSIGKIGLLIVPLSNVTLPSGEYSIGIKTNSPNAFHTASNVKSYRGYDNGEELPTTALNLNYPYSDMYGIFPSFSLLSYGSSIIDLNNRIGKIEKFGMNKREMIESLKCLGDNLNDIELKVLSLLRKVKIVGYRGELKLTVVVSNGSVTTLRLINSEDNLYLNLDKVQNNGNGCYYNRIIQHHQGSIITVEIEIDTNGIADFNYSYDSVLAPNLVFVETQLDDEHKKGDVLIPTLCENGIIGLQPIGKRKRLLGNTMYMKFQITEAVTLGSVLLYVENLPTNDINWVQVAIYPKDNGLDTAKMITTSNKIEVTSIGYIRLPLEHKVLQPGLYSIGIKTNCLDSFSTAQGVQSYRGYDSGNSMPTTAMNLKYPYSDGYGIFPSFSLVAFNEVVGIKYPANWGVKYEPEYSFIGQNDEKTLNYYIRGEDDASGGKIRKFYISNDGGLTKSQMHENNLDWEAYKQWGEPHTCVVTYGSNDSTIYYNTPKGYVIKCHIVGGIATLTDITPSEKSESASSYTVASYAPLVLWKGYLWWGEYQDPKTPRIHKMNISTEQWSISVEKPTNGVNGARHCHFLYKSPVDPNVLWAVWGDASNGAGQGINRLYAESITSAFDNWEQWTIGLDDAIGTTLPYPTAIIETYEDGIIGAGDQPPTHLLKCRTRGGVTGKYLIQPLNFKMETAPSTETCHWIAMDEEKTIYYMTVESNPYMSVYASPYPYTQSFRISKYWQQALAGAIGYSKGYIQTRNYRFPKLSFINAIDARNVSKVPYVAKATSENIVDRFNKLIDNLVGANILQSSAERGNDINTQFFVNPNDQFENWG